MHLVADVCASVQMVTAWTRSSAVVARSDPFLESFPSPRPLPRSPARPSPCRSREIAICRNS
jgi:hypothetical protein